uniref:Orf70 n=1 Tax=Picobiliphyte sp. MS584-11 TaxID=1157699 RepID=A0A2H4R8A8_9EUKA|nr:orf70 [Picobiliphyte sp. MS584-11]
MILPTNVSSDLLSTYYVSVYEMAIHYQLLPQVLLPTYVGYSMVIIPTSCWWSIKCRYVNILRSRKIVNTL